MEKQSEYRVNKRESLKNYLDESERMGRMLRASNGDSVGDCPKRGKEGPCGTSDDQACISQDQEIQIQKQHIETSLVILHNLLIEQVNMEFWSWFEMVMKGRENR